jgi:AcrR family transcriptional regulator
MQPSTQSLAGDAQRRRRQLTADAIEFAAIDLFRQRPYEQVTAAEIAEAARVSVRTFYRYFPSKQDLLLALPRRYASLIAEATQGRPATERGFAAVRAAIAQLSTVDDPKLRRWQGAVALGAEGDRMAQLVVSVTSPILSQALARRAHRGLDDAWAEIGGALIATALTLGAQRWAASGGSLRTHVLAAVDIVGSGLLPPRKPR